MDGAVDLLSRTATGGALSWHSWGSGLPTVEADSNGIGWATGTMDVSYKLQAPFGSLILMRDSKIATPDSARGWNTDLDRQDTAAELRELSHCFGYS